MSTTDQPDSRPDDAATGIRTEPAPEAVTGEKPGRVWRFVQRRSSTGLVLGWLALLVSFAPSLLPRPWWVQAVASALSATTGYAVGAVLGSLVAVVGAWLGVHVTIVDQAHRARLHLVLGLLALVITVVLWFAGYRGRRHSARLVGLHAPSLGSDVLSLLAAVVLTTLILGVVWAVREAFRASRFVLGFALPRPLAGILALCLVAGAGTWLSTSVLAAQGLNALSASAREINDQPPDGLHAPTSPLISGGPGSTQRWSDLGREGEIYTAETTTAAQITAITGKNAMQPIRVYAAPTSGDVDPAQLVQTIVTELNRTGALNRAYINLVGTTGSGWVDEYNVRSLEVLTGGDVATAAVQYSFLPSVAQFLTNRALPAEVGRELVQRVQQLIAQRPVDKRPRLLLSGESLGALSTEAAFGNADQLLGSVYGALWSGTPNSTPLWRSITASRQAGSPQVAPVIDNGAHIRFAGEPIQLQRDVYGRPLGSWTTPRVVFLQHPSDPIVWWDPSLIYSEPPWIQEHAGFDVDRNLHWYPLVTFWLTTVDLISANSAPGGHGHRYRAEQVDGWAGVLGMSVGSIEKARIVASVEALPD
ncbi:alpha/beta-hydrolase family protein [Rudaeicoccus suwonensis]|uniref:Putative membrane protein n=1 Tax=Rudaeicoccus suwonensis TaxID=657409 RepID=A0A561E9F6_9MICO|nr:alpha/beta-hydrolase family protein [Rudaeicoccus suwonensis]TWE12249.1 putative membrane protein [Rudaeicoccus suwonensis]